MDILHKISFLPWWPPLAYGPVSNGKLGPCKDSYNLNWSVGISIIKQQLVKQLLFPEEIVTVLLQNTMGIP